MNQPAVSHLTRSPDETTVPDYDGDQPQEPRLRARQASTTPNPPRETPAYSRPGFVGERAWLSAVTPSPRRLKVARTAVTGCGESGA